MTLTRQQAFEVLELQEGATEVDVKRAYKTLALKWHPDKNGNSDHATEKFKQISYAYQTLTNPDCEASDDFNVDLSDLEHFFEMMEELMGSSFFQFGGGRGRGRAFRGGFFPFPPRGGGRRSYYPTSADDDSDDDWVSADDDDLEEDSDDGDEDDDYDGNPWNRPRRKTYEKPDAGGPSSKRFTASSYQVRQLPRPVLLSRTSTTIQLSLDRKNVIGEVPAELLRIELDSKRHNDSAWETRTFYSTTVTIEGLEPGTKYDFRVRAGLVEDDGLRWGPYSVESAYATTGQSAKTEGATVTPSPAPAAAPPSRKNKKKQGGRSGEAHTTHVGGDEQPAVSAAAMEQEEAERAKEAARRLAMEQAAAEYAAEQERLQRLKETGAAEGAGKSGKKKKKGKKKGGAAEVDGSQPSPEVSPSMAAAAQADARRQPAAARSQPAANEDLDDREARLLEEAIRESLKPEYLPDTQPIALSNPLAFGKPPSAHAPAPATPASKPHQAGPRMPGSASGVPSGNSAARQPHRQAASQPPPQMAAPAVQSGGRESRQHVRGAHSGDLQHASRPEPSLEARPPPPPPPPRLPPQPPQPQRPPALPATPQHHQPAVQRTAPPVTASPATPNPPSVPDWVPAMPAMPPPPPPRVTPVRPAAPYTPPGTTSSQQHAAAARPAYSPLAQPVPHPNPGAPQHSSSHVPSSSGAPPQPHTSPSWHLPAEQTLNGHFPPAEPAEPQPGGVSGSLQRPGGRAKPAMYQPGGLASHARQQLPETSSAQAPPQSVYHHKPSGVASAPIYNHSPLPYVLPDTLSDEMLDDARQPLEGGAEPAVPQYQGAAGHASTQHHAGSQPAEYLWAPPAGSSWMPRGSSYLATTSPAATPSSNQPPGWNSSGEASVSVSAAVGRGGGDGLQASTRIPGVHVVSQQGGHVELLWTETNGYAQQTGSGNLQHAYGNSTATHQSVNSSNSMQHTPTTSQQAANGATHDHSRGHSYNGTSSTSWGVSEVGEPPVASPRQHSTTVGLEPPAAGASKKGQQPRQLNLHPTAYTPPSVGVRGSSHAGQHANPRHYHTDNTAKFHFGQMSSDYMPGSGSTHDVQQQPSRVVPHHAPGPVLHGRGAPVGSHYSAQLQQGARYDPSAEYKQYLNQSTLDAPLQVSVEPHTTNLPHHASASYHSLQPGRLQPHGTSELKQHGTTQQQPFRGAGRRDDRA